MADVGFVGEEDECHVFSMTELRVYTDDFQAQYEVGFPLYRGTIQTKFNALGGELHAFTGKKISVHGGGEGEHRQMLEKPTMNFINGVCDHPNILRFLGICRTTKRVFVVTEVVTEAEDDGHLKRLESVIEAGNLTWLEAIVLLTGISKAVAYLHEHNFCYQPLTAATVVVDEKNIPYLTNFDGLIYGGDKDADMRVLGTLSIRIAMKFPAAIDMPSFLDKMMVRLAVIGTLANLVTDEKINVQNVEIPGGYFPDDCPNASAAIYFGVAIGHCFIGQNEVMKQVLENFRFNIDCCIKQEVWN